MQVNIDIQEIKTESKDNIITIQKCLQKHKWTEKKPAGSQPAWLLHIPVGEAPFKGRCQGAEWYQLEFVWNQFCAIS
jgi:hypothetical protein